MPPKGKKVSAGVSVDTPVTYYRPRVTGNPPQYGTELMAGQVCAIDEDGTVHVLVFDPNGTSFSVAAAEGKHGGQFEAV